MTDFKTYRSKELMQADIIRSRYADGGAEYLVHRFREAGDYFRSAYHGLKLSTDGWTRSGTVWDFDGRHDFIPAVDDAFGPPQGVKIYSTAPINVIRRFDTTMEWIGSLSTSYRRFIVWARALGYSDQEIAGALKNTPENIDKFHIEAIHELTGWSHEWHQRDTGSRSVADVHDVVAV